MKTGVGLALIAVGAILAFAVTTNTSVFNLHTAGWVLIIIGIIGIAIPRRGYGWVGGRGRTRPTRRRPRTPIADRHHPTHRRSRVTAPRPRPVVRPARRPRGAGGTRGRGSHIDSNSSTRDLTGEARP